jgi:hypothetical protein
MNKYDPFNEGINAGYFLSVTSWENDADAYSTNIMQGLSYYDAKFYVDMANRFSAHGGMGGAFVSAERLFDTVMQLKEDHPHVSEETRNKWFPQKGDDYWEEDDQFNTDWLTEGDYFCNFEDTILGSACSEYYGRDQDTFYCRAVDKVRLFYTPREMSEVIYLK